MEGQSNRRNKEAVTTLKAIRGRPIEVSFSVNLENIVRSS